MTSSLQSWQPLSRSDRSVRRVGMRLPPGVSEHRAAFLLEEALRLMSLPGEDQGRTYYFRRVALRGISAAAPPREWVERAQTAMRTLAARAVHGADPRAAYADAVFFNSQQEALEGLLRRLLRSYPHTAPAAFWSAAMISPTAADGDVTMQVVAAIERLRSLPSGWFAAATALLEALESDAGAWPVLESIPERILQAWLSELGGAPSIAIRPAPRISPNRRRILLTRLSGLSLPAFHRDPTDESEARTQSAARSDTLRNPPPLYLLWLAALAVITEDPGKLARGLAAADGRALIEALAGSFDTAPSDHPRAAYPPAFAGRSEAVRDTTGAKRRIASADGAKDIVLDDDDEDRDIPVLDTGLAADRSIFTSAGGLYFLLNALRHLGIEAAIGALPSPLRSVFLHVLVDSLARAASVQREDPALLWVAHAFEAAGQDLDVDAAIAASGCWPRTLTAPPDRELTLSRLIRIWTLAVRRWCWRNAQLTLREIVSRAGRILLTRTDLDVTLAMDTVDLRIRREGLDLDPGWLPWFGRVVRFHYVQELSQQRDGGEAR